MYYSQVVNLFRPFELISRDPHPYTEKDRGKNPQSYKSLQFL